MFKQLQSMNAKRFLEANALKSSVKFIFLKVRRMLAMENTCQAHAQLTRLDKELKEIDYYALEMPVIIQLLRQIMTLDNASQKVASGIIQFALDCGLDLMKKYGQNGLLYGHDFQQISIALSKLPVNWQTNQQFLKELLALLQQELERLEQEEILDNIYILKPLIIAYSHLLSLPIYHQMDNSFQLNWHACIHNIISMETSIHFHCYDFQLLSALWKIYVKFDWFKDESHRKVFAVIENNLRRHHEDTEDTITETLLQKNVVRSLTNILNRTSSIEMQEEYSVGPYRCDIAFPNYHLAIEINGPCHYRKTMLRRSDKFRNYLIQKRHNLNIINLSYQDVDICDRNEMLLEQHLKNKLNAYPQLFQQAHKIYQPPQFRHSPQQSYQFFRDKEQTIHTKTSVSRKPNVYVPPALRKNDESHDQSHRTNLSIIYK